MYTRDLVTQTKTSLRTIEQNMVDSFESLTASTKTIHRGTQDYGNEVKSIRSDIWSLQNTLNRDIPSIVDRSTKASHSDVKTELNRIASSNHQAQARTIAEISALRDLMLKFMTLGRANMLTVQPRVPQMTLEVGGQVAKEVGAQLIRAPHLLQESFDNLNEAERLSSYPFRQNRRLKRNSSNGIRGESKHSKVSIGSLTVFRESHVSQPRNYRSTQSHQSTWTKAWAIQLVPLVQKTIRVTFTINFGAGGFSIAPSLSYSCTVQRSKSPTFTLLDNLVEVCAQRIWHKEPIRKSLMHSQTLLLDCNSNRKFHLVWNVDLLKTMLPKTYQDLAQLFAADYSIASCKDEEGRTLLHVSRALQSF